MELGSAIWPVFTQLAGVIFRRDLEATPQFARTSGLFQVSPQGANTGSVRSYTEFDREEYADDMEEGEDASRASVQQGWTKNLTAYRVAKNIGITYVMRTQNKYPEVMARLTMLGPLAPNRLDLDLTHRLTFGAATSYTNKAGKVVDLSTGETNTTALFDTTHDLRGSSTTYRNRLANNPRFSPGALEAMEQQIVENSYNQFGEKVVRSFDIIWSTDDPNTVNAIRKHLSSTADPDALNAGVTNVNLRRYRHVILPRLATTAAGANDSTKRYYWGLASKNHSTAHLDIWEEAHLNAAPGTGNNGEDINNDNWTYGVRMGYGICVVTGDWIHMSSGDGTA